MTEFKPILAKAPEQKEFKTLPAWQYPARCYWVIDEWTQTISWKWEEKKARKIRIMFEFPTEMEIFSEEKWEEPFSLSKEYTLSLSEQGNLRPMLESWRGKKFTDLELEWFDITKLIWVPAYIQVMQEEREGKTYTNINQILWLPKGLEIPEQINPTKYFSCEEIDEEELLKLPNFIQEKIRKSDEYIASNWIFQ